MIYDTDCRKNGTISHIADSQPKGGSGHQCEILTEQEIRCIWRSNWLFRCDFINRTLKQYLIGSISGCGLICQLEINSLAGEM